MDVPAVFPVTFPGPTTARADEATASNVKAAVRTRIMTVTSGGSTAYSVASVSALYTPVIPSIEHRFIHRAPTTGNA